MGNGHSLGRRAVYEYISIFVRIRGGRNPKNATKSAIAIAKSNTNLTFLLLRALFAISRRS